MNFGLKENEIEKIRAVFKKYSTVDKVILYGSRAFGKNKPGSDIDLTLIGKLDLKELTNITSDLDELVLPFRFDVNLYHQIKNLDLLDHINRVGVTLYEKAIHETIELKISKHKDSIKTSNHGKKRKSQKP